MCTAVLYLVHVSERTLSHPSHYFVILANNLPCYHPLCPVNNLLSRFTYFCIFTYIEFNTKEILRYQIKSLPILS